MNATELRDTKPPGGRSEGPRSEGATEMFLFAIYFPSSLAGKEKKEGKTRERERERERERGSISNNKDFWSLNLIESLLKNTKWILSLVANNCIFFSIRIKFNWLYVMRMKASVPFLLLLLLFSCGWFCLCESGSSFSSSEMQIERCRILSGGIGSILPKKGAESREALVNLSFLLSSLLKNWWLNLIRRGWNILKRSIIWPNHNCFFSFLFFWSVME